MMQSWIEKQKLLLTAELAIEAEQLTEKIKSTPAKRCEQQGLSLLHLNLVNVKNSLFGRFSITLESNRVKNKILDLVSFKPGDEVVLYSERNVNHKSTSLDNYSSSSLSSINGVVSKVNNDTIDIVTDQSPEGVDLSPPLRLDLRSNEYTHRKMMEALKDLEQSNNSSNSNNGYHPLIPLLFNELQLSPSSLRNTNNYTTTGPSDSSSSLSSSTVSSPPSSILPPRNENNNNKLFTLHNPLLNPSQINAIQGSLEATYISLIHGPPGTGKTSTLTELIFQCVARNMKVLVCAPSNVAVDNILEKIVNGLQNSNNNNQSIVTATADDSNLPRCLRLGHPARVSENILKYCLDSQIIQDDGTDIVSDIKKEINDLRKSLSKHNQQQQQKKKFTSSSSSSFSFKETRKEISALQKDLKKREIKIVKSIIQSKNVILCTTIGAGNKLIKDVVFDVVIIDECAQGLEVACWIPILRGKKCVLAGDHLQLPPTIKSMPSSSTITNTSGEGIAVSSNDLSMTLFERIMNMNKQPQSQQQHIFDQVIFLLNTQYRMNDKICRWASKEVYDDLLLSHDSVSQHTLNDFKLILSSSSLSSSSTVATNSSSSSSSTSSSAAIDPTLPSSYLTLPVLLLIDTAGSAPEDMKQTDESISHSNRVEAYLVLRHVKMLIASGMKACDIGVITPYNNQVQLLKKLFFSTTTSSSSSPSSSSSSKKDGDSSDDEDGTNNAVLNPYSNNHFDITQSQSQSSSSLSDSDWQRLFVGLEIRTVDGFQGGEKECIVLSLVRSNTPHRQVGFLRDKRRINVAVTRAKRHVAVICDVYTCSNDEFIHTLIRHIQRKGEHRYAEEYLHMSDVELWSEYNDDDSKGDRNVDADEDGDDPLKVLKNKSTKVATKTVKAITTAAKVDEKQLKLNDIELVLRNLSQGIYMPHSIASTRLQYFLYDFASDTYTSIAHEEVLSLQQDQQSQQQIVIRFPTNLSSYDRMIVHDLCDQHQKQQCDNKHQLYHRSLDAINSSSSSSSSINKSTKTSPPPPLRFVEVSTKPFNTEKTVVVGTATSISTSADNTIVISRPFEQTSVIVIPDSSGIEHTSTTQITSDIIVTNNIDIAVISSIDYDVGEDKENDSSVNNNDDDDDESDSTESDKEDEDINNTEVASSSQVIVTAADNHEIIVSSSNNTNKSISNNNSKQKNKLKKKTKAASNTTGLPPALVASSTLATSTSSNNNNTTLLKPTAVKTPATTTSTTTTATKPLQYYVSEERRKARADADKVIASVNPLAYEDDEAAMEAAIQANQVYSTMNQYRVPCTAPMPNPVKIQTNKALKSKIDDAYKSRQSKEAKKQLEQQQQQQPSRNGYTVITPSSRSTNNSNNIKKVDKKPTAAEMRRIRLAQMASTTSSSNNSGSSDKEG